MSSQRLAMVPWTPICFDNSSWTLHNSQDLVCLNSHNSKVLTTPEKGKTFLTSSSKNLGPVSHWLMLCINFWNTDFLDTANQWCGFKDFLLVDALIAIVTLFLSLFLLAILTLSMLLFPEAEYLKIQITLKTIGRGCDRCNFPDTKDSYG